MASRKWRKCVDELLRASEKTGEVGDGREPLLDAYLYQSRVKCGRAGCKCMSSDYRHEKWCVSFKENGRSRTLTIPDDWLPRIRTATDAYRETRQQIRDFAAKCQAATEALNEQVAGRVETGRALLAQLLAIKGKNAARGARR